MVQHDSAMAFRAPPTISISCFCSGEMVPRRCPPCYLPPLTITTSSFSRNKMVPGSSSSAPSLHKPSHPGCFPETRWFPATLPWAQPHRLPSHPGRFPETRWFPATLPWAQPHRLPSQQGHFPETRWFPANTAPRPAQLPRRLSTTVDSTPPSVLCIERLNTSRSSDDHRNLNRVLIHRRRAHFPLVGLHHRRHD